MDNENGGRYRLLKNAEDGDDPKSSRKLRGDVFIIIVCSPVLGAALVGYSIQLWSDDLTTGAQYLIYLS